MTMRVKPFDAILGATVEGLDLSHPLSECESEFVRHALASYGFLRFPQQHLVEPSGRPGGRASTDAHESQNLRRAPVGASH